MDSMFNYLLESIFCMSFFVQFLFTIRFVSFWILLWMISCTKQQHSRIQFTITTKPSSFFFGFLFFFVFSLFVSFRFVFSLSLSIYFERENRNLKLIHLLIHTRGENEKLLHSHITQFNIMYNTFAANRTRLIRLTTYYLLFMIIYSNVR